MIAALGLGGLLNRVLVLQGLAAYISVGALCFGEAAVLIGFVLPGETAAILGGVLASQHKASLAVMALVVVCAAIAGDSVGFEVGRRFGPWLLGRRTLARHADAIGQARRFLRRRGGAAVFIGRSTAVLRALVPGLAGMSGMAYARFLVANAAGGLTWGVSCVLLGYFLGTTIESASSTVSTVVLAVIAAGGLVVSVMRRLRRRSRAMARVPVLH